MVTGPRIRLPAQYEDMIAVKVDAVTDYCWIVMFFPQFIVFSLCQRLYFLKFVLQNNEMIASGVESAGIFVLSRLAEIALSSRGRNGLSAAPVDLR